MVSFYRSFSSRSSVSVSAGLKTGPSAVDAGCPAPFDQSAYLGERAVSLGGDYINAMALAAIDGISLVLQDAAGMSGGRTREQTRCKLQMRALSKLATGWRGSREREAANDSRQGPVAGDQQVGEPCVKPWRNGVGSERRRTVAFCSALTIRDCRCLDVGADASNYIRQSGA